MIGKSAAADGRSGEISFSVIEFLYYLYFALMMFAKGIGLLEGSAPYTLFLLLGALVWTAKMLLTRYTAADCLWILPLLALGAMIYHRTGNYAPLIYFMVVTGMKGIPLRRAAKVALAVWGGTFLLQVVTALLGLRADTYFIHDKLGQYLIRWSLGYPHPNVLHISYFILMALLLYCLRWRGKRLWRLSGLLLLGDVYIFLYSLSYTGMLITLFYLAANLYLTEKKELSVPDKGLLMLLPPLAIAFSVLGPVLLSGRAFSLFDKLLSTRFTLSRYFLTTQPIGLFGTRDFVLPDTSYGLDCSYVNALCMGGILFFALLCLWYTALMPYLLHRGERAALAVTAATVIAGISEPFLVNTGFKNITFLFIGEMMFAASAALAAKGPAFLGKPVCILSWGGKRLVCRTVWMRALAERWRRAGRENKKILLTIWLLAALLFGGIYAATVQKPAVIYSTLWNCDRKEGPEDAFDKYYVYIDKAQLPSDFNGRFLKYDGPQHPLYAYDGVTITFEYARKAISAGALGASALTGLCLLPMVGTGGKGNNSKTDGKKRARKQ